MGDFTVPSSWVGKSKALRFRTSTIDQSGVGPPMSSRCGLALAHIHGRAISSIRAHSTEGTPCGRVILVGRARASRTRVRYYRLCVTRAFIHKSVDKCGGNTK
jgi:hypothetical protein